MWKNFIWNDCQFAVVGKEKEYDRSQCFVVRKLFIRLRTASNFVEVSVNTNRLHNFINWNSKKNFSEVSNFRRKID